jgi:hypothetical protein
VALCDQDDVWKPGKISRAVALLNESAPECPTLYCSRLAIVENDLTTAGHSPIPRKELSFRTPWSNAPFRRRCNAAFHFPHSSVTFHQITWM